MDILKNFLADGSYILTLGSSFMMAVCLTYVLIDKIISSVQDYKKQYTDTAKSVDAAEIFMSLDPNQLFMINVIAMVVLPYFTWLVLGQMTLTIGVLIFVILFPTILYKYMRKQRLKRFEEQLPDGLTMISGAMRAGASLTIALESLIKEQPAPLSQEFYLFVKEQRVGVEFEESLKKMEKRNPLPDFSMIVTALLINREVGGNLAETLETLGATLRRKSMMEGKIVSLTAQGKLQGVVMTGLPILLGGLLTFLEPEAMSKLWTTNIGYLVVSIVIVMEFLGYIIISKITSIDV